MVKELLESHPSLLLSTSTFNTARPLHWAAAQGHANLIPLLLEADSNINTQDALGNTALHLAAQNGHEDIVLDLIARGAQKNLINNAGITPQDLAQKRGHVVIASYLEQ